MFCIGGGSSEYFSLIVPGNAAMIKHFAAYLKMVLGCTSISPLRSLLNTLSSIATYNTTVQVGKLSCSYVIMLNVSEEYNLLQSVLPLNATIFSSVTIRTNSDSLYLL